MQYRKFGKSEQIPISSWLPVVEEVLGLNRAYVSSL